MGNLVLMDNGGMNTALMYECTITEILNGLLVGKEHPLDRPGVEGSAIAGIFSEFGQPCSELLSFNKERGQDTLIRYIGTRYIDYIQ